MTGECLATDNGGGGSGRVSNGVRGTASVQRHGSWSMTAIVACGALTVLGAAVAATLIVKERRKKTVDARMEREKQSFKVDARKVMASSRTSSVKTVRFAIDIDESDVEIDGKSSESASTTDSLSDDEKPKSESLEATKKRVLVKWQNNKGKEQLLDIEDLVGKSLIPSTLAQMTKDGVKPYSPMERNKKMNELESLKQYPNFAVHVKRSGAAAGPGLVRTHTTVLQLNVGFYCNQACTHCHVDSSPKRKEMMTHSVAQKCLDIARSSPSLHTVDLTGGAPELNREFKFLVREFHKLGLEIIDRCNLTVLLEPNQGGLAAFLAEHKVHIIASLPCYIESNVASQRGDSIFERSIKGLQMLNALGYGKEGTGLVLDLVYNPTGLHLPPPREDLEADYKRVLLSEYDVSFNALHCITNMPINRFYDHLQEHGNLEKYMDTLVNSYNPDTVEGLMCRSYLSIDPHGYVFDCDFNQQLEGLNIANPVDGSVLHVSQFKCTDDVLTAKIHTKKHCFGCTAGVGSS